MNTFHRSPVSGFTLQQWRDGEVVRTERFFGSYAEAWAKVCQLTIGGASCFTWTWVENGVRS